MVLRGKNNGRSDGKENPDGDSALGTYQAHATAKNGLTLTDPGHGHTLTGYTRNTATGTSNIVEGQTGSIITATAGSALNNTTGISLGSGDAETRMRNVTVNHFIKIN
jgi:hypothetical protein